MSNNPDKYEAGSEDFTEDIDIEPAELEAVSGELAVIDEPIESLSPRQMEAIEEVLEA
jgi:hypothetical protein